MDSMVIRQLFEMLRIPINSKLSDLFLKFDIRRQSQHSESGSAIKKRYRKGRIADVHARDNLKKMVSVIALGNLVQLKKAPLVARNMRMMKSIPITCSGLPGDSCVVCSRGLTSGIIGDLGLGMLPNSEELQWVQCTCCNLCYHLDCLHLSRGDIVPGWTCTGCNNDSESDHF